MEKKGRIFKDEGRWVVDLGGGDPDFYFYFRTRREAKKFLEIMNGGRVSGRVARVFCIG